MDPDLQQFKAEFFKALAHPIRIQILELLRNGDQFVHELQSQMNATSAAVVSQQLAILRAKNVVKGEREGNKVRYSVKDEAIFELLDVAKKIFNNHLSDTISLFNKIDS